MEISENIQMRERSREVCTHRSVIFVIFTMEAGIVPVSLLLFICLKMPVSEIESKERHGGKRH